MERFSRKMSTGYPQAVRRKLCKLFGHVVTDIDYDKRTARCTWCDAKLEVSYDMYVGKTIITKVIEI